MGPTAAGKTSAAVELVREMPFEIVSADSALVYRGLDIGTAKPGLRTLAAAPHRLIDLVEPTGRYSAGQFRREARAAISAIEAAGRVPLVVGGTLLYFRALAQGLARLPPADRVVRKRLDDHAARSGWPALHAELARVDPAAAQRIHPNDAQRIQRALEVHELTGRPISEIQQALRGPRLARTVYKVVWCPRRETLYSNCEKRLNHMIENGFIDEVRGLYERGDLTPAHPAMRAVGYRQFWDFVAGTRDFDAARAAALTATRRLVKRQLTWLRAEPGLVWLDPQRPGANKRLKQIARRVVQASRSE